MTTPRTRPAGESAAGGFALLPAVDVAGGRVARVGSVGTEDPVTLALRWQAEGAAAVHLVDLDAAYDRGHNRSLLRDVVAALDIPVELAGGIVDGPALDAALASGCARAVVGSAALARPSWVLEAIAEHGPAVVVGLDVTGETLTPRGGPDAAVGQLWPTLALLDDGGCSRYVVTDVRRDGALTGPPLDLLRAVTEVTAAPVLASGGTASLADLHALAALRHHGRGGVEGAVVGAALLRGGFTLPEALAAVRDGDRDPGGGKPSH